jgi:signal transduction histidine kinase
LTAIRGYVEAALDDTTNASTVPQFLQTVLRHTAAMERLVTDLLRLARLDARQEPLERTSCDVRQLFGDVVTDLEPTIEAKRQHVTIDVRNGCRLWGDPAKLQDILRNLVENAAKYGGGRVFVTVEPNGEMVDILVEDDGPGIPKELRAEMFTRGARLDTTGKPGTGLGLAIVRDVAEIYEGRVSLEESEDLGGLLARLTLPSG